MLPFWIVASAFCYGLVPQTSPTSTGVARPGNALRMRSGAAADVGLRRQTRRAFLMIAAPALTTLLPWPRRSDAAVQG